MDVVDAFTLRVNLIPLSEVEEFDGERAKPAAMKHFFQTLENAGINATLRHSKGLDLQAACGQLRSGRLLSARFASHESISSRAGRL